MSELRIWVDDLLGRITMYRLVIYGLLAIALASVGLMFSGYLSYSPASFAASIIISVGVSYGANRLFGWLFGIRPHAESAIITGLIISLLFSPPVTILAGVKLALIATIAAASKYLLVIRGKHVFNPTAIAIVIGSVSGLAYATWWIATPALIPVTTIVIALILYKTQKFMMALTFIIVAVFMIILQSLQLGTASLQSISAALTSWPLIFFAGIMLTEPLTLPPRRTQQLVVAAGIGVLMTLPLHYGALLMTPALALVIGNIVSFWLSVRRTIKLRLVSMKRQGRDGYELLFDTTPINFVPGQYIELSLPHPHADSRGVRRIFSIIGRPQDDQLSIATRLPEKPSTFKRALLEVKPGQTIYGTRIAGDFVLPADPSIPVVCIAGGIGMTPYISFLLSAGKRDLTIIYSVRSVADLMFVDELRQYDAKIIVVSLDDTRLPDTDWQHESGQLTQEMIGRYVTPATHVYISGPPGMVTSTKQLVNQAGVTHIHTDHFTGY
jgi:ferredoxin-NADP reductase/Na+-translocating ferredoxin:NAD+ oxidoreductase RnfD subunit